MVSDSLVPPIKSASPRACLVTPREGRRRGGSECLVKATWRTGPQRFSAEMEDIQLGDRKIAVIQSSFRESLAMIARQIKRTGGATVKGELKAFQRLQKARTGAKIF